MNNESKREWINELFNKYQGRLLRYTRRWVKESDAQEIVQDLFIKLLNLEDSEKIKGRERSWLFFVCRNQAIDCLRKEKKMSSKDVDELSSFDLKGGDEVIEGKQTQSLILQLVDQLKPKQKEVIVLKFQEDLSYAEISEITGLSVSHVGVLIHEAIKKMKSNYQLSSQGRS